VETIRRDALQLACLLRAGELTAVWVPDEAHEAMRDLVRARQVAVEDVRCKRQAISSMMLRQGRTYSGKKTWGARHMQWLQAQRFEHLAQHFILQDLLLAVRHGSERRKTDRGGDLGVVAAMVARTRGGSTAGIAGINLATATMFMAEIRGEMSPRSNCLPSTTCSAVSVVLDSSTVMTLRRSQYRCVRK
jgi:transposase